MNKPEIPFSKFDERFYDRLAQDTPQSGRQLWRILRANPHLGTGRVGDVLQRTWIVPISRTPGRSYRVDLKDRTCTYELAGHKRGCPDLSYNKKGVCVHIQAARVAEKSFLARQRNNNLIFPDAKPGCGECRFCLTNHRFGCPHTADREGVRLVIGLSNYEDVHGVPPNVLQPEPVAAEM